MKKNTIFQKSGRALLALILFSVPNSFPVAALPQTSAIRSLNFNEFSYRVGPYCGEFAVTVKVHQGKFANEKATFEVSQVLYGSFTGSGQEQAVVVASCSPKVVAHPGFENDLAYVYGIRSGQPELLAVFVYGEPRDFTGAATEAQRQDKLILFDVIGVSVGDGSISFERMAGEARCCPTFSVTQTFQWANGRFALVGEERRSWKESQTQGRTANGVQMLGQDGGDFVARYPWYVEAMRRRIAQNWLLLQSNIDPAARASRTVHATAAFTIDRDGAVKEIRIIESSHNASFDNSGLRAVMASGPMPRLPRDYSGSYVSVTIDFPPPPTR